MSTRYLLRHYTEYRYEEAVESAHNQLRMLLRDAPEQNCLQRSVRIRPTPSWGKMQTDYFGNRVLWTELDTPHTLSRIFVRHVVAVSPAALCDPRATPSYRQTQAMLATSPHAYDPELAMYRLPSRLVPLFGDLRAFAAPFFEADTPVLVGALALMHHIHGTFRFDSTVTSLSTPIADILKNRHGVCQDFAHLMVGALRTMGLAARYVSGYIETLPPPGQPRLVGADASHAWVSLWCGDAGWQDLDPTNAQRPCGQHLTTAWGRDYDDIIPLNGVISGGGKDSRLKVHVDLKRLPDDEDGSPSAPR